MLSTNCRSHPSRFARRGAAIYAMVLLLAFSVVGAGLTLVTVQASERRILQNIAAAEQADLLARTGAEWLMHWVEANAGWRTGLTNGVAQAATPESGLSFSVSIADADASLSDDDTDSVTLTATGMYSGASYTTLLTASPNPHDALRYAIIAGDDIDLGTISVASPFFATDRLREDSVGVVTSLAGASYDTPAGGSIDSGLTPANAAVDPVSIPTPDLSFYIGQATTISLDVNNHLENVNLTPTANSQGTANSRGIYYVHAGWNNVDIRHIHLKGTLIIEGYGWNTIKFDKPGWLEQGPDGYPTLLIKVPNGQVDFKFPVELLDEGGRGVDYNEDGDQLDTFSSSIQGLVWVTAAKANLFNSSWTLTGTLIATWDVHLYDGVTVKVDPALTARLVPGFTDGRLHVIPGSVR